MYSSKIGMLLVMQSLHIIYCYFVYAFFAGKFQLKKLTVSIRIIFRALKLQKFGFKVAPYRF